MEVLEIKKVSSGQNKAKKLRYREYKCSPVNNICNSKCDGI